MAILSEDQIREILAKWQAIIYGDHKRMIINLCETCLEAMTRADAAEEALAEIPCQNPNLVWPYNVDCGKCEPCKQRLERAKREKDDRETKHGTT